MKKRRGIITIAIFVFLTAAVSFGQSANAQENAVELFAAGGAEGESEDLFMDSGETDESEDLFAADSTAGESEDLVITAQPENACVAYPEEACFHVEVNHPEQVASYQWFLSDGVNVIEEMDGTTAATDTLVFPSSVWSLNTLYLECRITDKEGRRIWTDAAELSISNPDEEKPVLYVGEYALQPGGSLDLSDTIYGSGTISFAEDMNSITLDRVLFCNDRFVADSFWSPSLGLYLEGIPAAEHPELAVRCIGDNVIENTFFDGTNSGGVTVNLFYGTHSEETAIPTVTFEGEGTLTVLGGERCINTDTNLVFGVPLIAKTLDDHYCDTIRTYYDITICEGVNVELSSFGEGIGAGGIVRMEKGSFLSIEMGEPYFMQGTGVGSAVRGSCGVYCEDAQIMIRGTAKPDRYMENDKLFGGFIGVKTTEGDIVLDHTKVSVEFDVAEAEKKFTVALRGLAGDVYSSDLVLTNGSEFTMKTTDPDVSLTAGISMFETVTIEDSTVNLNLSSTGKTGGIGDHDSNLPDIFRLRIRDSRIDIRTDSIGGEDCWGIRNEGTVDISLSDDSFYIDSRAADGTALSVVFESDEPDEELYSFDPDYKPVLLRFAKKEQIESPAGGVISTYAMKNGFGIYMNSETVYDPADTSAPASEVRIRGQASGAPEYDEEAEKAADIRDAAIIALAQLDSLIDAKAFTASTYGAYAAAYNSFKKLALEDTATASQYRAARSAVTKAYLRLEKKAAQPMTAKASTKTVSLKKVKKANQTVKGAITVKKAQGKVTYKKSGGNSRITISSSGRITVKKGLKKGTYKIKVKVTAAGNGNYKTGSKTVTVTIKVK